MFTKGIDLTIKAKDGTAIEPVEETRKKGGGTKNIEAAFGCFHTEAECTASRKVLAFHLHRNTRHYL